jgi:hypothetical protein
MPGVGNATDQDAAGDPMTNVSPPPEFQTAQSGHSGLRSHRRGRAVGRAAAVLALLGLVAITAAAAILFSGATELGFLRDRIATAIAERLGPQYQVTVGRAIVEVDPELGLSIDVVDVSVRDAGGSVVLSAPSTRLAIDPIRLLLLDLRATRAAVARPTLSLARHGRGYRLGVETAGLPAEDAAGPASLAGTGGFPAVAELIRDIDLALGAAVADPFLRGFTLSVSGATIAIRSAVGEPRQIADLDLALVIDAESGDLRADIAGSGRTGRFAATLARSVDPTTGERLLTGGFSELSLAELAPSLAGDRFAADVPFYGSLRIVLAPAGEVKYGTAQIDVGAGVIALGEARETVLLDEATLRLRWDVAGGAIVVEPSAIHFGQTRATFTGAIRPEGRGRYGFSLAASDAVLAPSDSGEPPLPAGLIAAEGAVDLEARTLEVTRLVVETARGSFGAALRLGFAGETPSLAMAASLTPMPVATWKQMWPPFVAPGARRWALANIVGGRIASAEFRAAVPAGILWNRSRPEMPAEAFRLDLRLEDMTVRTFGELPPITAASGNAVLAGATFGIDLDQGSVVTPSGAAVTVTGGAFAIEDVFDPASEGVIEVELSGDAAALGEIADAKPISALAQRDLAPSDLSGRAEASVSVRLPLELDESKDAAAQVDWKVVVSGKDLASARPIEGRMFSDADVTIAVTSQAVTVNGAAKIDGLQAAVSIAQPLSSDGRDAPGAEQVASLSLDRAARLKLGLDIEDIVSGVIDAEVRRLDRGDHYDLDLTRARLVIPGLGWSKAVGIPATMSFDVIPDRGGSRVENIRLDGDRFGFVGSARLGEDQELASAKIRKFHLRPGDDVAFELRSEGPAYVIDARGSAFDIRKVIDEFKGDVEAGAEASDAANVTLTARLDSMRGFNGRTIENATVVFSARDGVPREIRIDGQIKGSPVSLLYSDSIDRARLEASAADAGAIIDLLDIYRRIGGGHLAMIAERPGPTGALAGTLSMTGFAVLDEPAVREVVSRARPRGGAEIDTAKMHVQQMDARFRYTGEQIFIDDAFLRGEAMGATFGGVFDLVRDFVSVSGTFIPVYGINNAFSRVPVVGRILGGAQGEGLIGVTFKVEGDIDGPRVYFNPLSAVAPGIFRKIFEFR